MNDERAEQFEDRVLVLPPTARDAATSRGLLEGAGIRYFLCGTIEDVCREAGRGAGAAVVTAEAVLGDKAGRLSGWLQTQPPWSDFPLVVLTPPGDEPSTLLRALEAIGHMTLMKRPVHVSTLISTVRSALRDRQRQYAVRDLLEERRRVAEDLRKEHERFRAILDSITDGFISVDRSWRFTYVNPQAERILARAPSALLGKTLWDEYPGLVGSEFEQVYRRVIATGLAESATAYYPDHDRWYEIRAYPAADGLSIYFRDASDQKRAEEQVRQGAEANAKFRTMFEQGSQLAGILALDGTVVEANRRCLEGCGFTRDEVIGRPYWECGWWNRSPALMETVRAAFLQAAAGQLFQTETSYFLADGTERFVDLILAPVTQDDGRVLFVVPTGTDITDRKRAEDALKEADRRKDNFIALLAHELRNPLAPLRNGLQVMRLAGRDVSAVSQARAMMERQLSHMVRLIDDLLDVSRISRNKMELRRSRVLLADVISNAVETARPAIEAAGHELSVSIPAKPIFLDADLTRLAQVFSNLLTNSAKYTERGGHIWLSAESGNDTVTVSIRDTGIGIPADALPCIFDMFSQLDRGLERSTGGLGIGLALVKGFVEMHGGTVTAASPGQGKGSAFTVRLPSVEGPSEPTEAATPDAGPAVGPKRRTLVVDDSRDSAASMAMMLKLLGNEVAIAHDGIEAVEAAATFHPQLILMDVGMPRLNGLDATRRIREQPWGRNVLIIALTGWGQEGDKARSQEAGCDGHLVKPVDLADLEKLLTKLTAENSARKR